MTNPYQAPLVESEAPPPESRPRVHWVRRMLGGTFLLASSLILLYCGLIYVILLSDGLAATGPVSLPLMLLLVGLITIFGLGFGAVGLGLWSGRNLWAWRGAAAMGVAFGLYVTICVIYM